MELALLTLIGSLGLGLEVQAPAGCITASELEALVEREVGPFAADARIAIAPAERGWRARLDTAQGARQIETSSSDCRGLDRALVLVVALLADPVSAPESVPLALTPFSTRFEEAPSSEPEPEAPAPYSLRFGVDGAGAVGALPKPTFGGRMSAAIGVPFGISKLWVEGGFLLWYRDYQFVGRAGHWLEVTTKRFEGDLEVCALVPLDSHWELGACAGGRIGQLSLDAVAQNTETAVMTGAADWKVVLGAIAELRAGWRPVEELLLRIAICGAIDFIDPTLVTYDITDLDGDRSSPIWGMLRLGAHWEL
jgi:hypothetical protein